MQVEEAKRTRYPETASHSSATPFVLELGGRWGAAAVDLLQRLLRTKLERDPSLRLGGAWAAQATLQRWQGQIAACVQRAVASAILDASGAAGGAPWDAPASAAFAARAAPPDEEAGAG